MDPSARMQSLVTGYRISQAIHVAATLGLSDLLADGPRGVADLAVATDCHPATLHRLLRALASVDIYRQLPDGRFAATPLGDELRSDTEPNQRALAAFVGRPDPWQSWSALLHSVRTGENAYGSVHGLSAWEHRAANPEDSELFDAAMTAMSRRVAASVLEAYDFGGLSTLVDVAGGRGALLAAVLGRYPAMRGILFDQPHVVAHARAILDEAGVADRCEAVAGDMFSEVPAGGDGYMMKAILHDWADPEAVAILRNCRSAMHDAARLLIVERFLDDADPVVTFGDLNMLVGPGGLERTRNEYQDLLAKADLRMTGATAATGAWVVIEAVPA